ncbi:MAG: succinate dehydrogenase iron-sulfur subunit [Cyanobacteriota bacterium]|jgi:succinate dehydrogenase / fumarate reductase iron-sulfur subunit
MDITLRLRRQRPGQEPYFQSYSLTLSPQNTLLDALNQIKWEQDGTVAYRKNCRNAICGSCAMRVNDRPILACQESIGQAFAWLEGNGQTHHQELTLSPLGNLPVLKDLVVDMNPFWADLDVFDPYLLRTDTQTASAEEFRQSPQERAGLDQVSNCILCGACYSDCDAKMKNSGFVGPHALAKVNRYLLDSRDQAGQRRLERQNQGTQGLWGCNNCKMCKLSCPKGVAPLNQIEEMKIRLFDLLDPL